MERDSWKYGGGLVWEKRGERGKKRGNRSPPPIPPIPTCTAQPTREKKERGKEVRFPNLFHLNVGVPGRGERGPVVLFEPPSPSTQAGEKKAAGSRQVRQCLYRKKTERKERGEKRRFMKPAYHHAETI